MLLQENAPFQRHVTGDHLARDEIMTDSGDRSEFACAITQPPPPITTETPSLCVSSEFPQFVCSTHDFIPLLFANANMGPLEISVDLSANLSST